MENPETTRPRFGWGALLLVGALSAAVAAGISLISTGGWPFARGPAPTAPAAAEHLWVCPMHPKVVQDHPGDCPICGMKLVLQAPAPAEGNPSSSGVPGLATINVDPERQKLIGLTTAEVTRGPVGGEWRTVGRVAVDETRVQQVNVKVEGFVEQIFVDFVGKSVRRGDPLFALYSPPLLAVQEELLLAIRTRAALARGGALGSDGEALVQAARRKLALSDVPPAAIERIEKTGTVEKTLTFLSPASGVVTRKEVSLGMKLDAGAMPYEIVDLSRVWVLADVYENELSRVREGLQATLTLNAFPGRRFEGHVLFVDPLLDPKTRTVKVRLSFPNPGGDLRPEMFGEVVLHASAREGLSIPADAVIDSGTEQIAFVDQGQGRLEPRRLTLGERSGERVEVTAGLEVGLRVVTRANFLIDSESRLRASLSAPAGEPAESARVLHKPGDGP